MLPFPDAILSASPLWGAFERLWASLLHVAFGLLIAAQPWLVLLTMVLHSSTNLALLVAQGRASFAALQVVGAVWAGANLILAIAVTR